MLHSGEIASAPKLVRRTEGVLFKRLKNEMVLVNLSSNQIWSLNVTGARIWEELAEPASLDELCNRLRQDFVLSPESGGDLREEVAALLDQLADADFLRAV